MDDKKFESLSKPQQDVVLKIASEAERQGVNPKLAIAIAEAETGGKFGHFDKDKVLTSPAGARGVMQIMPSTATLYNNKMDAGIDPDDEDSNIKGGVFILKDLLTKYKSPRVAVAMYNASPKANAEFVKQYETNPDAAIMSLRPETHKYSLRVSQNFNLDDDKETGLMPVNTESDTSKATNPFENYETDASKSKRENQNAQPPKKPEDKQGGISDPEIGAVAGAVANTVLPMFTDPKVTPKIDTSRAQEANIAAQDRLELANRNLQRAAPEGTADIEEQFRQSRGQLEQLGNEQRLAQQSLRGLPRNAPTIEMPAPPAPPEAPSRTTRGDPGAVNWIHSMASDVPEAVANQALNMRGDNPRGGQYIIDRDMAAREQQARLGMGDFELVHTQGGAQLALPPTTVRERRAEIAQQTQASQAELENRTEQARIQQERQAQQLEQQRLAHEADLERIRQQRSQVGQQHNELTSQLRTVTPLQREFNKAQTDAELAQRRLARANQQPTAAGRMFENAGVNSSKIGVLPRTIIGAGLGYYGVMSYNEALARFKAGDTSEGVMKALQAASAGAALLPPAGKALTKIKGAGLVGLGTTVGLEGLRKILPSASTPFPPNTPQQ